MKYQKLKKQVVIETAIAAAVMIVLGVTVYLISSIRDDYAEGNDAAQKQVDTIDLETKTLKGRYNNIHNNLGVYLEVQKKQAENRLAINRQMVLEKFNLYKNQYVLNGLHLTVSPAQDIKESLFHRKNSSVNFSDVNVSFDLVSDENVYELVDSLRDELPGISKVIRLKMVLDHPFNEEAFQAISQKGTYPMIKAEIRFIWFGINSLETADAKTPDAKTDAAKTDAVKK